MIIRHIPTPIMHRVVEKDDLLFLGGVTAGVAAGEEVPMKAQAARALDRLGEILSQVNCDKSSIVSATVYLTDLSKKAEMNEAWVEWFGEANLPARATIGVAALSPGTLIEIVAVAGR